MDRTPAPPLLPIFRSQQQAEILTLLLGDPDTELGLTEIAERAGVPYASVHREIERSEAAGLITSRKVGRTRLVQANTNSPYFTGLSDVLVKAFGPPQLLSTALSSISGIDAAYIYGSWAARFTGEPGDRPVGDIDVLVLGTPDRDALYAAVSRVEQRVGRPVQMTIRARDWLAAGSGTFHATVTSRPMVPIPIASNRTMVAGSTR